MLRRKERRPEQSGPYWKQRSWQLSAGFLGIVVVLGGIVALTSSSDSSADARAKAAASKGPLSGTPVLKNGRPQGCRTDDSAGDALPKAAPKDITWRTTGVTRVPISSSAGPTRVQGPLWWCFAHTPTGAAMAASVIPSRMSGHDWRTVTEQQVISGTGRNMFEFQRSAAQDIDSQHPPESVATYAGFSVISYKSTEATVKLLLKNEQGYAATDINLRWSGGDWKVLPDNNGSLHTRVSLVQNTKSFTLWGS